MEKWLAVAKEGPFEVAIWSSTLGVSKSTLQRRCRRFFDKTPKQIVVLLRNQKIEELAGSGVPGKLIHEKVGLHQFSSLSRSLARDCHQTLKQLRNRLSYKAGAKSEIKDLDNIQRSSYKEFKLP